MITEDIDTSAMELVVRIKYGAKETIVHYH